MTSFYKNQFEPFETHTRMALSTFYVTDDVSALSSIRRVDNNKFFFGLMKRSLGKSSEYGLEIASEIKNSKSFMDFVKRSFK